jgi:hypothetical protein
VLPIAVPSAPETRNIHVVAVLYRIVITNNPDRSFSVNLPKRLRDELVMMKIRSILGAEIESIVGRPVAGLGTGENMMSYLEAESGLNKKQLNDLIDSVQLTDADLRKARLLQYEIFSKEIRAQNNEIRRRFGVPQKGVS